MGTREQQMYSIEMIKHTKTQRTAVGGGRSLLELLAPQLSSHSRRPVRRRIVYWNYQIYYYYYLYQLIGVGRGEAVLGCSSMYWISLCVKVGVHWYSVQIIVYNTNSKTIHPCKGKCTSVPFSLAQEKFYKDIYCRLQIVQTVHCSQSNRVTELVQRA